MVNFKVGLGFNIVFGSTHEVKQLSLSLFLSILIFNFYLILGSFLTFWGHNRLFLVFGEALIGYLWG